MSIQYTSKRLATLIKCDFIHMTMITISKVDGSTIAEWNLRVINDTLEAFDFRDQTWSECPTDIIYAYKQWKANPILWSL